ncbi:Txe/YoeB family addiction module toxin [Sanguibacter gelidistatuariae]|uniref:Txe/YoeB family addiction module toxin n=1 Tax=Sanguibacter gelidistatuariae TaxID=1814289 RepID=UPI003CCC23EC
MTDSRLGRLRDLLRDIARGAGQDTPHEGIGKPEALKQGLHGYWSRRITDEHRLIYKVVGEEIRIAACRFHYSG